MHAGDAMPAGSTVEVLACVSNALFLGASGGLVLHQRAARSLLPAWAGIALLLACASPVARFAEALHDESLYASLQLPSSSFELLALLLATARACAKWGEPARRAPLAGRESRDGGSLPLERSILRAWLLALALLATARVVLLALPHGARGGAPPALTEALALALGATASLSLIHI